LDRPPAISSKVSGATAPTFSTIHVVTVSSRIPATVCILFDANSAWRPLRSRERAVSLFVVSDVTDATFGTAVMERSMTVPVIVDLWATWCQPCKTLSPILEKVVGETNGAVELAKVDVDANPQVAQAFGAQSIPAVFAIDQGKIVDTFVGAVPEPVVRAFVEKLAPGASVIDQLVNQGDEASLRSALELDATNVDAAVALAELLRTSDQLDEATAVLAPFEHLLAAKTVLARIHLQQSGVNMSGDLDLTLEHLLEQAKTDETARANLLEMLDALGPQDPRYVSFRRRLANFIL
jgi:putative thioredoxin